MGGVSWMAVKGEKDSALDRLGFVETGDIDFSGEASLVCAALPSGWVVFAASDFDFLSSGRLGALARDAETVGCRMWDTVMCSEAWGYSAGDLDWSVAHNPEDGIESLETTGALPPAFTAIRDEANRNQARREDDLVDEIFDVPGDLVAAICGFHPEKPLEPGAVLKVIEPVRSGGAAVRRAAERSLREQLTALVEADLYSAAHELGFVSVIHKPEFHKFYPHGLTNAFVRHREQLSENLQVFWGFRDGAPAVIFSFFVRHGSEPRYGRSGTARRPSRKRSLRDVLIGRRPATLDDVREAVASARTLLVGLDRYLAEGVPHPDIDPPVYWDDEAALAAAVKP